MLLSRLVACRCAAMLPPAIPMSLQACGSISDGFTSLAKALCSTRAIVLRPATSLRLPGEFGRHPRLSGFSNAVIPGVLMQGACPLHCSLHVSCAYSGVQTLRLRMQLSAKQSWLSAACARALCGSACVCVCACRS